MSVSSFRPKSPPVRLAAKIVLVAATNRFHVSHHIGIAVSETPLKDVPGTAVVGCDGEPHVAVKFTEQIGKIPNSAAQVLQNVVPIANTIHGGGVRHELHQTLGIFH